MLINDESTSRLRESIISIPSSRVWDKLCGVSSDLTSKFLQSYAILRNHLISV